MVYDADHDQILMEKHPTILECLSAKQACIFSIEKTEIGYRIVENVDYYAGITLTQQQFERLIAELQELAKSDGT